MSTAFAPEDLFSSSPSPIALIEGSSTIIYANPAFLRMFPYAGAGGLPEDLRDLVQGSGTITIKRFVAGGMTVPMQFSVSKIAGTSQVLVQGMDLTELLNRERRRNAFLVRMGHEFRTTINTVTGYAQLLKSLDGLSPVAREYAGTILYNEGALLHLLDNLIELTKFESGQTELQSQTIHLPELIQETVDAWEDQARDKYLTITVTCKEGLAETCKTDTVKLRQVLSNLIGNAMRFTRKGGITLTVSGGPEYQIDIEDTGIGIPADEQSDIFEVFTAIDQNREGGSGSGIGLAVARIFARLLDGDLVLVRSDTGKGSVFRFTFNAEVSMNEKPPAQRVEDYSRVVGISKPCKVLLVDDVDINLAMLEIFLAPAGFDVTVATDGDEAIERFTAFKPDIVFMDLLMPGRDGFDATREIKKIDPSIPVVALTASIVDSVREQAIAAGVNGFMNKPFIPERFFEIIAEHTDLRYILKED